MNNMEAKEIKNIEDVKEILISHDKKLGDIKDSLDSISWLADISKGTQLLKKPSLWLVAFILGIVALMGGLKALIAAVVNWVIPVK